MSANRWRTYFKNIGIIKLTDTRKYNTERSAKKIFFNIRKIQKTTIKNEVTSEWKWTTKKVRYDRNESVKKEVSLFSYKKYDTLFM